jgi:hypothetical protein
MVLEGNCLAAPPPPKVVEYLESRPEVSNDARAAARAKFEQVRAGVVRPGGGRLRAIRRGPAWVGDPSFSKEHKRLRHRALA